MRLVTVLLMGLTCASPVLAACGHNPYAYSEAKRHHYRHLDQGYSYHNDRHYKSRRHDCRKHSHTEHRTVREEAVVYRDTYRPDYVSEATRYPDCPCRVVSRY